MKTLIIVPPFASLYRPSIAAHILQASARKAGFEVDILYSNLLLARYIGESYYQKITYSPAFMLPERLFASMAYGVDPISKGTLEFDASIPEKDRPWLASLQEQLPYWIEYTASEAFIRGNYSVVGSTNTFYQTAPSISLLNRIKTQRPDIFTIMGGANCLGEMADGLLSLSNSLDYIFIGDSEASFPRFLSQIAKGDRPGDQKIEGEQISDLDTIHTPVYHEFYEQFKICIPNTKAPGEVKNWLPYETSRGCWWGQKHHCKFCGIGGRGIKFREKSADRVLEEFKILLNGHPEGKSGKIYMVDNIMPFSYFKTLLPKIAEKFPGLTIFYEQKANLNFDRVKLLKDAGITRVQPGVEGLSTSLLKRMNKGVTTRQNIAFLRYSKIFNILLGWNLLYGIPNDKISEYKETLELLPLIRHLQPPSQLSKLRIDRFSPYFSDPEKYNITRLTPKKEYAQFLPVHSDINKIAYHFEGEYPSESLKNPELISQLKSEIEGWKKLWKNPKTRPKLEIKDLADDKFELFDTRGLKNPELKRTLCREEACLTLWGSPSDCNSKFLKQALEDNLVVLRDNYYVPLALADPELMKQLKPVK